MLGVECREVDISLSSRTAQQGERLQMKKKDIGICFAGLGTAGLGIAFTVCIMSEKPGMALIAGYCGLFGLIFFIVFVLLVGRRIFEKMD